MVYGLDADWITKQRLCDKQERTADQRLGFQEAHRIGVDDIKGAQSYIELVLKILKWLKVN